MKNLIVGQSGGPTCAINSSLAGVIKQALNNKKIEKVYGMVNGIEGFMKENIITLERFNDENKLKLLRQTPSSYLGSCRKKLPDPDSDPEFYEKLCELFKKYNIGYFVYIGGNDSMDTVKKLSYYLKKNNIDIISCGIPKTIDNDLVLTDHTPGYGSCAKFIANSIRQLAMDTGVYDVKSIVITEIMGRNAGWLTAAAALANTHKIHPVDIILLPETVFDEDKFIEKIKKVMENKNCTIIAVSEGIKDKDGNYLGESKSTLALDGFNHAALGGVGKIIESIIKNRLNIKTRSIEFSTLQRCFSQSLSLADYEESFMAGYEGCAHAIEGNTGFMAGFKRISNAPYQCCVEFFDVNNIANLEKKIPDCMISDDKMDVTDEFIKYALPLINNEPEILYTDGLIDFEIR